MTTTNNTNKITITAHIYGTEYEFKRLTFNKWNYENSNPNTSFHKEDNIEHIYMGKRYFIVEYYSSGLNHEEFEAYNIENKQSEILELCLKAHIEPPTSIKAEEA